MVASGDVLLDIACSPRVRAAVQSVFPSCRLRAHDIEAITRNDRVALNQACAVVLGVRDQRGAPSTLVMDQLREIAPHIGIFVVEERSEVVDPWLRYLAASGADDAFALDWPGDEKVLGAVLANRVVLPPPELQLRKLWSLWADCPLRIEAMYCVRNGYRPWHGFEPHLWWGLRDRAMRRKFDGVGLPTPLFLTRFGRILLWSESLMRGGVSRIALATILGFKTLEDARKERRHVRKGAAPWPSLLALLG